MNQHIQISTKRMNREQARSSRPGPPSPRRRESLPTDVQAVVSEYHGHLSELNELQEST